MLKETKSNWECVTNIIKQETPVTFSPSMTQLFFFEPQKLLSLLNQYKFAAKLLKKGDNVLDLGCGDGVGSYIMAKQGLEVHGLSENESEYELALKNFTHPNLVFSCGNIAQAPTARWDAIVSLNSSQIVNQPALFLAHLRERIAPRGLIILGLPQEESLFNEASKYFREHFVFLWSFAIKNELILAENNRVPPQSPSILVCGKKKT